jgi:hypothetical protein
MKARLWVIAIQIVAAVLGLMGIGYFILSKLMQPSRSMTDAAMRWGTWTIVLVTAAVVIAAFNEVRFARRWWLAAAVVVTLLAGTAPHILDVHVRQQFIQEREAELAREDAKALDAVKARTQDVEARITAGRRYSSEESLAFVNGVSYVDLRYRGLPNRSPEMLALLKRALEAKILDPNIPVKGPRPVDVNFEPLFVHYYRATIRPFPENRINLRDWETLKVLVASGADMTLAGAGPVADDLRKPVTPDNSGRFFQLQ